MSLQKVVSVFLVLFAFLLLNSFSLEAGKKNKTMVKGDVYNKETKSPMSGVRILLAKKQKDKPACVIHAALTAITDNKGNFQIRDVPYGEYVVFYNLSGKTNDKWEGLKVEYSPVATIQTDYLKTIQKSLGVPLTIPSGSSFIVKDGNLVLEGYMYAEDLDFYLISTEGELFKIKVSERTEKISVPIRTAFN
ncbi:MAG: SpaA isopeptide-forming pilin-related protein [Nitrospirota bacterium]